MAKKRHVDLRRDIAKSSKKKFVISLPLPPSVNHMHIHKRNGSVSLTREAEKYIRVSRAIINSEVEKQKWNISDGDVWYYADLVFFLSNRILKDSHNMIKLLLDVMQGLLFNNDYFVMPRIYSVELDMDNPRVEVVIRAQTQKERAKILSERHVEG